MKSKMIDRANATTAEQANPVSVAVIVGTVWPHKSARFCAIWSTTRDGAGSKRGDMPDMRT
jgi:hypothetical protein